MVHSRVFSILLHAALSNSSFRSKHYPADEIGSTACGALQISRSVDAKQVLVGDFLGERFANLVTRESKCRRITVRPWHRRCSLSGDSSKRIIVAGCSE